MTKQALPIDEFIDQLPQWPLVDVRTPAEYGTGHIPGAHNIPLFSNEERKVVGTLYKHEGSKLAFLKGLEYIGPKMKPIIKEIDKICDGGPVLVHCWRGGMRSGSVANLLRMYGLQAHTLVNGYKAYRNWALAQFSEKKNIMILGGMTGSGKTRVLHALADMGQQVIDLEGLAGHKGSAFGTIGMEGGFTQEQFENELAMQWHALDKDRPVWLEDEGRTIGRKVIPAGLWESMSAAPVVMMEIPRENRIDILMEEYGPHREAIKDSLLKIKKRLGGLAFKEAMQAWEDGELRTVASLCLRYYDKSYTHELGRRPEENIHYFAPGSVPADEIAQELLHFHQSILLA